MPEDKKQQNTPRSDEFHWEKNEKDAGNNQWTSETVQRRLPTTGSAATAPAGKTNNKAYCRQARGFSVRLFYISRSFAA